MRGKILCCFIFLFFFYCPAPGYCFLVLEPIGPMNMGDVKMIANAVMGGLAVMWGLRKAVKFINRS